jgi:hypothetical protein
MYATFAGPDVDSTMHMCWLAGFGPLFGAGVMAALGRVAGTNGGMDLKTSPGAAIAIRNAAAWWSNLLTQNRSIYIPSEAVVIRL